MEKERLVFLLDCFVANRCSVEEKEELMRLLDSPENNEITKAYLEENWNKVPATLQLSELQSHAILSSILPSEKTRIVPFGQHHTKWYWAAAAILLLTLGATAYYLSPKISTEQKNLAAVPQSTEPANDFAPGSSGAVLTLADGSTIILDSASDGNLAKQANTKIVKQGGSLQYISQQDPAAVAAYNSIATPRGRQFKLVLEDGTKVWLNAESSIRFPAAFGKTERRVNVTGEAYFEVAKNASRPFKVLVRGTEIQVLGTHFNVNAYNDEPAIKTTLLEGSVKVTNNKKEKMLAPGQQAKLDNNGDLTVVKNVNTATIIAWKNDQFSFKNTSLDNLLRQLSRWYDVEITTPQPMEPLMFTGSISRDVNLSDVLKMLELTGELKFKIEGKKVTVKM